MHILVTAGPTREYLDAVRFLSSPSSGRMGLACAVEARKRGHRVTLVTGPVNWGAPKGVRTVRVVSARHMYRAVAQAWPNVDAVIMTAAVSDYRPSRAVKGKIKKSAKDLKLRLTPNPDILAELGKSKKGQTLIGFAVEVQDAVRNARKKLERKNLDYIVLNSPRTFGAGRITATVYRGKDLAKTFREEPKASLARWLVRELERVR